MNEQTLLTAWNARVARFQAGDQAAFSPGVVGLGEMRVFGGSGDLPATYPQISSLDRLDDLAPDERFAVNRLAYTAQRAFAGRRAVAAAAPGQAMNTELIRLAELRGGLEELATKASILILNQITGG